MKILVIGALVATAGLGYTYLEREQVEIETSELPSLIKSYDKIMDNCNSDEECDKAKPICDQILKHDKNHECINMWPGEDHMMNQNYIRFQNALVQERPKCRAGDKEACQFVKELEASIREIESEFQK